MAQLGWIFDTSKCVACRACVVACQMENNTPPEVHYRWVFVREKGVYPDPEVTFTSMACYHCQSPACIPSCPVDAISKDATTGLVVLDEAACIGCKYCMAACPYGAPQADKATGKVVKCTGCITRVEQGLDPACANTCVGGALQWVADASWGGSAPEGFAPTHLTKPSVKFLG